MSYFFTAYEYIAFTTFLRSYTPYLNKVFALHEYTMTFLIRAVAKFEQILGDPQLYVRTAHCAVACMTAQRSFSRVVGPRPESGVAFLHSTKHVTDHPM
jgi:hypothetical protein